MSKKIFRIWKMLNIFELKSFAEFNLDLKNVLYDWVIYLFIHRLFAKRKNKVAVLNKTSWQQHASWLYNWSHTQYWTHE